MIEFVKAQACGNDFLIVDASQAAGRDLATLARDLCARTTGVGADGVAYLTRTSPRAGRIRLYNADGSVAEISGNGTRCVAAWIAYEAGLHAGDVVDLETDAGVRPCTLQRVRQTEFQFTTGMGTPLVRSSRITLHEGYAIEGAVVSTGNPHFVIATDAADFSVAGRSWQQVGAEICTHADFPAQTNVEFVRRISDDQVEIRIYERGVGPTSSSGTGTSASAAAMIALYGLRSPLRVVSPGGGQTVSWSGGDAELQLTGPAGVLARGQWLSGAAR